ncbi:helix-turn-helix transcriptional regulator [Thermopolyspora sp. NPDC052614]|uniref:helix-turn-helix domain-containing protein n=1 Tax=Thermopolyspora sp. NPDC052614 TaxID=3155682 RepID=UPI0034390553
MRRPSKSSKPVTPDDFPAHMTGSALRWWRQFRGMTLEAAAQALHRDLSQLARWERAERPIPEDVIGELDHLYDAGGRLVTLPVVLNQNDRIRSTVEPQAVTQDEDEDMERRALMQMIATMGVGSAVNPDVLNRIFAQADKTLGHAFPSTDEWEWTVYERWLDWTANRPGAAIPSLASDLLRVTGALNHAESGVTRSGLTGIAAQLAALMGCDLNDVGQRQSAEQAFATARRFADASADRALAAWVRGLEASSGLFSGRPLPIVRRLTKDALELAGNKPSPGAATAQSMRAIANATDDNKRDAQDALKKMTAIWEQSSTLNSPVGPSNWMGASNRLWVKGYVHALIGEHDHARRAIDEAEVIYARSSQKGAAANLKFVRAFALVTKRDTEGIRLAVEAGNEMSLSAVRRTIGSQIIDALPPQEQKSEATQELRSLIATAATVPPPSVV